MGDGFCFTLQESLPPHSDSPTENFDNFEHNDPYRHSDNNDTVVAIYSH
jgi:hypothetical protein